MLAGVAAVPAIALAGVWQYSDANIAPPTTTTTTTLPPPPADQLATELLSFRRHPTPLAERAAGDAAIAALSSKSDALLDAVGEGSCVQVTDGPTVVAEESPGAAVIPASNEKLFVAAVALDVLGPDYRFRTELQAPAPVGGVVAGSVYLVGGGDPLLRTADVVDPLTYPSFNTTALEALADQLVVLGVTQIDGDIVGDGTRYDDEFRADDEWGDEITVRDAGRVDALLVNDGLISPIDYALDPTRAAAGAFRDLITARGVTIVGSAANGVRPADGSLTTLALIESAPLTDVLVEMLHTSDNNTAEMILKEIGFVASGLGTRQAGLDAVRTKLQEWGVPVDGLDIRDGSGLSRNNRTTCATLATLVNASPVAQELVGLLPAAGRDGTLKDQLLGTPAEGQLVAKTGTLTDVKALTGSQPGGDGQPVQFSLVLNQPGADEVAVYGPAWNALVELIDAYPVAVTPDVATFEPR